MRILFIVSNFIAKNDANINIANLLVEILKKNNQVSVLGSTPNIKQKKTVFIDDIKIYNLYLPKHQRIKDSYKKYELMKINKQSFISCVINDPISIFLIFMNKYFPRFNECKKYQANIKRIIKNDDYDLLVSISNPFYTVEALSKIKSNSIKLAIFLDPYSNYEKVSKESYTNAFKREFNAISKLDHVFVVDFIHDSYKNDAFQPILHKIHPFKLPNIREIKYVEQLKSISFDFEKINCIFVGGLYDDIRNPKFLLDLFTQLNEKYVLYIVGSGAEDIIKTYKEILKDRIIICGKVNRDIAFNAMIDADILINIGNTLVNQMPSKILDYISLGKPIVNLVKLDKCKTLSYTSKYPLCINIREDYEQLGIIKQRFSEFCIKYKNQQLKYSEVSKLYSENTAQFMVENILLQIGISEHDK